MNQELPVVIIGAGPVGLAAAAHLEQRGLKAIVLEAGRAVGAGVRSWSHVRMFSPWRYSIDNAARRILEKTGWVPPDDDGFPTGGELATRYLEPLAHALNQEIRLNAEVIAVGRESADRLKDQFRATQPFVVRYLESGEEHEVQARAVIDASGTIRQANPLGANGLPARNERTLTSNIRYGIPDVLGTDRHRYIGKRVAVVGSGHSAQNLINDLARLAEDVPTTRIHWVIRQTRLARVLGGGLGDQLAERGRLGLRVRALVDAGRLTVHAGFHVRALASAGDGVILSDRDRSVPEVDEVIVATGFRPDFSFLDELRLDIDPIVQSTRALAPLIDPNQHSCGSVRPHGAKELGHPEGGIYLVGMKSYGRAPTFLLLTGHEQVRSVVAEIAGDHEAAARVELVLPETGVCITDWGDEPIAADNTCCGPNVTPTTEAQPANDETRPQFAPVVSPMQPQTESAAASCCGGPSTQDGNCCVADDIAKASDKKHCGCRTPVPPTSPAIRATPGCCA